MYKDGGFKVHEKSEGHVNAIFAWGEILDILELIAKHDPVVQKK